MRDATNMTIEHFIAVATQLKNGAITEKEIIDLYGWDDLIKIKVFRDGIELGYIMELTDVQRS